MGIADLIPGVSGGTIAFITGIYEKLLEAVASLNREALTLLLKGEIKSFLSVVHTRFIFILACGILSAIFSLARIVHFFLVHYPVPIWGLFFGLIFASIFVIWKELKNPFAVKTFFFLSLGSLLTFYIVGLIPVETPYELWFIYLCGVIGITAMILPGLSGSFILLLLGKYEFITAALKAPFNGENFLVLFVFSLGALTGLLSFSKLLNWFLKNWYELSMALLTGVLIGSLRKVWPWKEVLETVVIRGKERIISEANVLPQSLSFENIAALCLMTFGIGLVLFMESKRLKRQA